ncbi:T9SS type B sorting domain-containing protein [Fulvivirga sp. RKSG066]|uniref:T9SS type B sorting domain-containing protein n=1 Tax=Fulvivirga aurantia TaxID=2529383 RepID=UPI0012BC4F51|nr:gliding motility-associated C-terminal domain-containing protein [Fulvivirga aurantia]MTI22681.1 T9SS type B sorting domain-containing protein [Fulvivirga aurantia]
MARSLTVLLLILLSYATSQGQATISQSGQSLYIAGNGSGIVFRDTLNGGKLLPMGTAGFASNIEDIAVDPVTNRAFWSADNFIWRADIVTTTSGLIFTDVIEFVDLGSGTPAAIEIDAINRDLYWIDLANNLIQKTSIDQTPVVIQPVLADSFIEGLALDPANGKLYYTRDITSSEVRRANLDGSSATTIISGFDFSFADFTEVAVDQINGKLYFNGDFSGAGEIWMADLDGSSASRARVITNLEDPRGMAVDGSLGLLFYADSGPSGNIGQLELDGSNPVVLHTGIDFPVSVALDLSVGTPPKVYWTEGEVTFNQGEIHRTNLDGTDFERYYDGFNTRLSGIALDTENNHVYFSDGAKAEIKRASLGETGFVGDNYELLLDFNPSQDDSLEQVAWDPVNRLLYYTYWGVNEIQRIDPNDPSPISTLTTIATVTQPVGITVDHTNSKIYYTGNNIDFSGNLATLYRANLDGTNEEKLFEVSSASPIEIFYDVKVDAINNRVYWSAGPKESAGKIYSNDINETPPFSNPTFFNITGEARGIDLDLINNKIYWVCRGAPSITPPGIMRANLDGTDVEKVHAINISNPNPAFLALDLRGLCGNAPTVSAGNDQAVCLGDNVSVTGSVSSGGTNPMWSTSGDGQFDNPTMLNTSYMPGSNDESNGSVTLTLTAFGGGTTCPSNQSSLSVTISSDPAALDYDRNVSAGQAFQIDVQAENESSNNESLAVAIVTNPTQGTASLAQGVLTYTANAGTSGSDLIAYEIRGACGSDQGIIDIQIVNQPPVVNTVAQSIQRGAILTFDWCELIDDPDNEDSELTVTVVSISSGASTSINNCEVEVDYSNVNFSGNDAITLRACDPSNECDENSISIVVSDVGGQLLIFNAVSPNGDGLNDFWEIQNLTSPNAIEIYNRWGDNVKTLVNYNGEVANNQLDDLPTATYFYKIKSPEGSFEGYLVIKE